MKRYIILSFLLLFLSVNTHNVMAFLGSLDLVQDQTNKEYLASKYGEFKLYGMEIIKKRFPVVMEYLKYNIENDTITGWSDEKKQEILKDLDSWKYEEKRYFSFVILTEKMVKPKDVFLKFDIFGKDFKQEICHTNMYVTNAEDGKMKYAFNFILRTCKALTKENFKKQNFYLLVTFPDKTKVRYLIKM